MLNLVIYYLMLNYSNCFFQKLKILEQILDKIISNDTIYKLVLVLD